ncbi:hypothetical protein CEUSTIGMA_g7802.t1 [Chlamydomonas eustigma]|uniref:RRM domain-containing protein n=1 Tax=Chlamydomonas eustigma TaxID=1157962 RepID=A0A250XBA0_9CHLO|nr:hypothetical protein CEUSTIGMA_g7802.t1 [Chlamydomonas eustigma]|eukprot:GAX80363.1 hypothetical protein CEUSTIGMA_g7802.t1 [Chlamydomonas eustigma]
MAFKQIANTIFIGNIPYDVSEQDLITMFSEVGPIKNMRLVTDKDTGKPKGFAFCEFYDGAAAECAVRNLNQHEVSGRVLKVAFAEENPSGRDRWGGDAPRAERGRPDRDGPRGPYGPPAGLRPVGAGSAAAAAQEMSHMLDSPAMAAGPAQEQIDHVLGGKSPLQLFQAVSQMKTFLQQNPAGARQALISQPQLTRALFQAQILLGMIQPMQQKLPEAQPTMTGPQQHSTHQPLPQMAASGAPQIVIIGGQGNAPIILDTGTSTAKVQAPLSTQQPLQHHAAAVQMAYPTQQQQPQVILHQQPQVIMQQQQQPVYRPQMQVVAPLQPAAPAPMQQQQQPRQLSQQEMVVKLMAMTPDQVEALPPTERAQAKSIIQLVRDQLRAAQQQGQLQQ